MEMIKVVVIDSNAYSDFRRGKVKAREVIEEAEMIILPVIVMGELLAGFASGQREEVNVKLLNQFLELSKVIFMETNLVTAQHYAQIYLQLRKAGTPIPTNDMWIAALAKQLGTGVFTYDKHFDKVEGIHIVRTKEDFKLPKDSDSDT